MSSIPMFLSLHIQTKKQKLGEGWRPGANRNNKIMHLAESRAITRVTDQVMSHFSCPDLAEHIAAAFSWVLISRQWMEPTQACVYNTYPHTSPHLPKPFHTLYIYINNTYTMKQYIKFTQDKIVIHMQQHLSHQLVHPLDVHHLPARGIKRSS